MKRSVVGIVIAVALAIGGTVVLVTYVRGAEQRALAGERVVPVLVAERDIAAGTAGGALSDAVKLGHVPSKVRPADALDAVEDLAGMVPSIDLRAGEQILSSRLVTPQELAQRGAVDIPAGFQQVTLSLTPAQGLGGLLRPGDLVGVAASFGDAAAQPTTHLVLNKVMVTNVQGPQTATEVPPAGEAAREAAPPEGFLVTLAVDAAGAERLIFAAEHGSVWLTRQPNDVRTDGAQVQTMEKVFQ